MNEKNNDCIYYTCYLQNPTKIFFRKDFINDDICYNKSEIVYENHNVLYVYYPLHYNFKFDLNKGYDIMYLSEYTYNKCFKKSKLDYLYQESKYIKCVLYKNKLSDKFLELDLQNKSLDCINDYINNDYKFITVIINNDNYINDLEKLGFEEFTTWYELIKVDREEVHCISDFNSKLVEIKKRLETNFEYHKPKLLLHSCCAPCSSYCLELLNNYFDISILYYNPNIIPEEEYIHRLNEQKKLIEIKRLNIKVVEKNYNHNEYLNAISGINDISEGGNRCFMCYRFRFEETAKYAFENNFDYFSTTLSISPYKNSQKINEIGIELENKYNVKFLYSNFKLNDGYKKSIKLSQELSLYRQEYCGCEFSLNFKNKD